MTTPITFSHPVVRNQLFTEGEVVIARPDDRTVGVTDARENWNGEVFGSVDIQRESIIPLPTPADLRQWDNESGFETREGWFRAIEEFHGSPDTIYIFRVELRYVEQWYTEELSQTVAAPVKSDSDGD